MYSYCLLETLGNKTAKKNIYNDLMLVSPKLTLNKLNVANPTHNKNPVNTIISPLFKRL
jgi:hypothetical protein